jgi:patatin-like phospholipase/acyl hydrolase
MVLLMRIIRSKTQYDFPTAVTFLMAGLGIGSLLAILLAPRAAQAELVPLAATSRSR